MGVSDLVAFFIFVEYCIMMLVGENKILFFDNIDNLQCRPHLQHSATDYHNRFFSSEG